jgi:metal-responsive CopG/Arc/MetJ family transcriptional regulator
MRKPNPNQKRPARRMRTHSPTKRVVVDFPAVLLAETEQAAAEMAVDRSKLIRSAVRAFLGGLHRQALERELAVAYEANAELGRRISEEFAHVDSENI